MIPFLYGKYLANQAAYLLKCSSVWISRFCYPSFLPASTLHHSSGCVVYLFRQLGWNWASQAQRPYPLINGRKSWSCFKLLQFWLQFLHHQIQIWIGALLSQMCFLDFLTPIWVTENAVRVGHKSVTQWPFCKWMSSLSALTSRTGQVSVHNTIQLSSESLVALLIIAKACWQ